MLFIFKSGHIGLLNSLYNFSLSYVCYLSNKDPFPVEFNNFLLQFS